MIDRLMAKIESCGAPVVVGLDPTLEMVPDRIKKENIEKHGAGLEAAAAALFGFNKEVMDGVYDIVPAVKPQIAMYERFGPAGVSAYAETAAYAKSKGLMVIGDVKRGDIASTAEAYAAHIGGVEFEGARFDPWQTDAVTLNPYMGFDGIKPFVDVCIAQDKGVFILVKTSNPSSAELQDKWLRVGSAEAGYDHRAGLRSGWQYMKDVFNEAQVYEHVAGLVSKWGESSIGACGYSKVAAVVGATFPEQGASLRRRMPHTFFLVPGYGAQGAAGADLKGFFDSDGRGCIVNSSRGIIAAWKKDPRYGDNVGEAAREAALSMVRDLELRS